jgi:S-adenosylmethionine synthetase
VQLSYTLGLAEPVSIEVDTLGTGTVPDAELSRRLRAVLDFLPAAIVARFGLRRLPGERGGSFYRDLAAYGQMGRVDLEAPWEDTAAAEPLLNPAPRRRTD